MNTPIVNLNLTEEAPHSLPERAGAVTCAAGRRRAYELAVINGRSPVQVSKSDWEQASQELSGGADTGSKQAALNLL